MEYSVRQIGHLFDPYRAEGKKKESMGYFIKELETPRAMTLILRIEMKFTTTNVERIGISCAIIELVRVRDSRSRVNIANDIISGMPEGFRGTAGFI